MYLDMFVRILHIFDQTVEFCGAANLHLLADSNWQSYTTAIKNPTGCRKTKEILSSQKIV